MMENKAIEAQTEKIHDKGDIVVSLQIYCLNDEYYLSYRLPMEGGTRPLSYDEYKNIIDVIRGKHLQPSKPDVCTACYGKKGYSVFHQDNSKDDFTGKDLGKGKTWESLETCPRCNGTGEEPKKPEKPEIMLQPGQYMRDNEGNITTYEDEQKERLKDSQPKEVKPIYDAKDTESNRKHIIEDMC